MSEKTDLKKAKQKLLRSLTNIRTKNKRFIEKCKKNVGITQITLEDQ